MIHVGQEFPQLPAHVVPRAERCYFVYENLDLLASGLYQYNQSSLDWEASHSLVLNAEAHKAFYLVAGFVCPKGTFVNKIYDIAYAVTRNTELV